MMNANPMQYTAPPLQGVAAPMTTDAVQLFKVLKRKRFGFLIAAVVGFLIASLYLLLAPHQYQADAMIRIGGTSGADNIVRSNQQQTAAVVSLKEESDLIRSREVLEPVIDARNLQLTIHPLDTPTITKFAKRMPGLNAWLAKNENTANYAWVNPTLRIKTLTVPESWTGKELTLVALSKYRYSLYDNNIAIVENAAVGRNLSFKAATNGAVDIFVEELVAHPNTAFSISFNSLHNTLTTVRDSLTIESREQNARVMALSVTGDDPVKSANLLNDIVDQYSDVTLGWKTSTFRGELEFFEQRLPELKADMDYAETELGKYRGLNNSAVGTSAQTNALIQRLANEESKLLELQRKKAELNKKYTALHPEVSKLDNQIDTYRDTIGRLKRRIPNLAKINYDLVPLERDAEATRKLYTEMNERVQRLRIAEANTVDSVQIIDRALPNHKPVSPKKKIVLALSVLGSLFLYALWVLLRASLSGTIDDDVALSNSSGLPVFMNIPESTIQKRYGYKESNLARRTEILPVGSHEILAIREPEDFSIENLRGLRSMLSDLMFNSSNNTLMICSPLPAMGKSFVSVNLAVLLAQSGKRVLLVDADYQRGYLHKTFAVEGGPGLVDAAAGTATASSVVRETGVANLYVIPRGHHSDEKHSTSLNEGDLHSFLIQIAPAFDIVIIDTPPILSVATAATVGRAAGTSLMVVKESEVTERQVQESIRRLQYAGVTISGCILNNSSQSASHYAYYKDRVDQ